MVKTVRVELSKSNGAMLSKSKFRGVGSRLIEPFGGTGHFVLIYQVLRYSRETMRIPQHGKVAVHGNSLSREHLADQS